MTNPFISSEDLGAYLVNDNIESNLAAIALDGACERVRGYIGYDPLYSGSTTFEWVDADGTDTIFTQRFPMDVDTVVVYPADRVSSPLETLNVDSDILYTPATGRIWRIDGAVFPAGRKTVLVNYTVGFADIPSDMRLTALQVAARIYDVGMVENESTGGVSTTWVKGAGNLTPDEKDMLRRYRI